MSTGFVKVLIELPLADWYSESTETLWATRLESGHYRLENSPFYARGYSFRDVVHAEFVEDLGFPVVRNAVEKSGHSTYAVWVSEGVEGNEQFAKSWEPINALGCSFEGVRGKLLSVDIPANANIREAYRLLQMGEDEGAWHFQEHDVGHAV
jgi:hypothetical protein